MRCQEAILRGGKIKMVKVINPLFPDGIGCLRYKPRKNLKNGFTHVVFINKREKKKGGEC